MNEFQKSLEALKKRGRFRQKRLLPKNGVDFASNDYLGLKQEQKSFEKAVQRVKKQGLFSSSASQLVYGYQKIHKKLEESIQKLSGFEEAITVGSGFLANSALVTALASHNDLILMDEEYHASGISSLIGSKARHELFLHNDADDLRKKLQNSNAKRVFVFVESVYSMIGDILPLEIIKIADEYGAYLVIDEAHGHGVIGENLGGIYDFYRISQKPTHIKMGTLSKAIGSYGAYIAASSEVISFLINRAKPIIYSTALSPMDAALALERLKLISKQNKTLRDALDRRLFVFKASMERELKTPIAMIECKRAENIHQKLLKMNIITGFIRPPTVKAPSLRLIARLGESEESFVKTLEIIKSEM